MKTPRTYGPPSPQQVAQIRDREDFNKALRNGDQKLLLGLNDSDGSGLGSLGMMGFASVVAGVQTNRFAGYSDYLAAGTSKVWATARAIDVVANVILSTETKLVFRDKEKNKGKAKPNPKAALITLLQNPNPYETISELLYLWVAHMKLTGNCFWLKDRMNSYGQPLAVYCLNPRFMRIVPDKDLRVAFYLYRVNGTEIRFEADEIIHFRRPHANDPLWGLGEIESSESLYDDHINRALYNTRFMANGAMPSGILVRDEWNGTQEEWDRTKGAFNEAYGGVKNAGKVAWMNGKWSLLQMGITAQQMQELEKSKQNTEAIFLNHGVPLSVIGYGSANYATARQEDINFRRYTCLPLLNLFADAMNSARGFVGAFNPELRLTFSLSGLVDVEQVMKESGPLFDRGGLSSNDLRELCGFERKEDPMLDQYFVTASMVPVEIAGVAIPSEEDLAQPASNVPEKPKPKPGETEVNTEDDAAGDGGNQPPKKKPAAAKA